VYICPHRASLCLTHHPHPAFLQSLGDQGAASLFHRYHVLGNTSHFSLVVALLLQSFGSSSDHYSYDLGLVIMISAIRALFQTHIVQYDNRFNNSIVFQVTQNQISLCHLQRQINHHRIHKRDSRCCLSAIIVAAALFTAKTLIVIQ